MLRNCSGKQWKNRLCTSCNLNVVHQSVTTPIVQDDKVDDPVERMATVAARCLEIFVDYTAFVNGLLTGLTLKGISFLVS